MEYNIKAIPTTYKGINFRSRLEAKWAAFFDLCGWQWQYEPFDMDGWIPDFQLIFQKSQPLVEVKPISKPDEEIFLDTYNREIHVDRPECILIFGTMPFIDGSFREKKDSMALEWYDAIGFAFHTESCTELTKHDGSPLDERSPIGPKIWPDDFLAPIETEHVFMRSEMALFGLCSKCSRLSFVAWDGDQCRNCGNVPWGDSYTHPHPTTGLWNKACNSTQWRARR